MRSMIGVGKRFVLILGFCTSVAALTNASAAPLSQDDGQSWDKNLPSASRFVILAAFTNAAVRDKNTGLVWEKAPNITLRDWASVTGDCGSQGCRRHLRLALAFGRGVKEFTGPLITSTLRSDRSL